MTQSVWLITGCTSGIGKALAEAVLAKGDLVVATARAPLDRLAALKDAGALILEFEVSAGQEVVNDVVQRALDVYGHIDVLVPCAGYIHGAFVETIT